MVKFITEKLKNRDYPSKRYIRLFTIRFIAYLVVFVSSFATLAQFGPIAYAEFSYRKDQIFNVKYTLPQQVVTSVGTDELPFPSASVIEDQSNGFGNLLGNQNLIKPVSTDYGIVIEKINANAKVIAQVDPADEKTYIKALQEGVVEAKGSTIPGEPGNIYIFSHSTDAPWNIARYNAIFYLLRELVPGDRVILFYQGRRYDYIVFDKTTTKPDDVTFLANRYNKPVLTLQTCDPPGTLLNRLIVRAKLAGT
jgi:LPXTG-site transpeptidase (sortase) family protein